MSNFSNFPSAIGMNLQQVNTDYDPYIIKPPDRSKTHGNISKHLIIDSRDRDYILYPSSNRYRIEIPQEWKDVVSIELTLAQIPNTFYNITPGNNVFYISDSPDNLMSINIPEGQYTNESLVDTLNGKYGDLFINFSSKLNFARNPINLKFKPPIFVILPVSSISPVIAISFLIGRFNIIDINADVKAQPALGPSLGVDVDGV